jgi:hypothetical protein
MKIILSPAKTFHQKIIPTNQKPIFEKDAFFLMGQLRKIEETHLQHAMKLSDALLKNVLHMIHNFGKVTSKAIFSYHGQAYKALDAHHFSEADLLYAEHHLWILSGLYGILRPSDGISPYRLEMQDQTIKNLYRYWKPKIKRYIEENTKDEIIINLASEEYSKVIDPSLQMITLDFVQVKDGNIKRASMHIKTMRGLCAKYIVKNRIENPEDLKLMRLEGYAFHQEYSTLDVWVFIKEVEA